MSGEPQGRDDIFPGWVIFDRLGGGFLAVRKADGEHVEGDTQADLTVQIVAENVVRTWREAGLL